MKSNQEWKYGMTYDGMSEKATRVKDGVIEVKYPAEGGGYFRQDERSDMDVWDYECYLEDITHNA